MNILSYFLNHCESIRPKLIEHIMISGTAMVFAILIGVPLGIFIVRKPWLRGLTLNLVNIFQTLPSLALLALFIPFLGIGIKPTLLVLIMYALLPIVRSTYTGLKTVPTDCIEATIGLGFTPGQRMLLVELPLALPVILSGIRTASAMTIGITAVAALIGAGGLGDYITQGLALNDTTLILLGAIPTALLAVCVDFLLAQLEHRVSRYKRKPESRGMMLRLALSSIIIACLLGMIGVTLIKQYSHLNKTAVTVASKNFTESMVLAEIMSQTIEAQTKLAVKRKYNLGATAIVHQALLNHEIDMYPEYTGTALLVVLKQDAIYDATALFNVVQKQYNELFNLQWLPSFGFSNANALGVTANFAQKHQLHTVSDLQPLAQRLVIGAPAEFIKRPDALPALQQHYQINFSKVVPLAPDLIYQALDKNTVQVIQAFSTDAKLAQYHVVLLQDDKHIFPPYEAAPIVRKETLEQFPALQQALLSLTNTITEQEISQLNYQVSKHLSSLYNTVHQFLMKKKLVQ